MGSGQDLKPKPQEGLLAREIEDFMHTSAFSSRNRAGARAHRVLSMAYAGAGLYAANSSCGTPTSIGLLSGSWLHSNQPPSYTAIRCQSIRYA
jgi:hypothetical protein